MNSRYKRGWFGESHRHYLASKGIKTNRYFVRSISPEKIYGEGEKLEFERKMADKRAKMLSAYEQEYPAFAVVSSQKTGAPLSQKAVNDRVQWEKDLQMLEGLEAEEQKNEGYFANKYFMPVYVYRDSTGRMHKGDETDNERRVMYGDDPLEKEPRSEAEQFEYAKEMATDPDVDEVRLTDTGDFMIARYKKGEGWTTDKGTGPLEKKEYEVYENIAGKALVNMKDEAKKMRFAQKIADNADERGDGKVDIELLKEVARNADE